MDGLTVAEMRSIIGDAAEVPKGPVDDVAVVGGTEDPLSGTQFLEALAKGVPAGLAKAKAKLPASTNSTIKAPHLHVEADEICLTQEAFFRSLASGIPLDDFPVKKAMRTLDQRAELEKRLGIYPLDGSTLLAKLKISAARKGRGGVVKLINRMIEVEEEMEAA